MLIPLPHLTGVYLPHYLKFDLNWQTFHGPSLEIAQGLTLRHSPGHTPGLCILQLNLQESGTWIFTSDQYHVKENYEASHPQGWLARDHDDWVRSNQMIHQLAKRTDAKIIFGHCAEVCSFSSPFRFRKAVGLAKWMSWLTFPGLGDVDF